MLVPRFLFRAVIVKVKSEYLLARIVLRLIEVGEA